MSSSRALPNRAVVGKLLLASFLSLYLELLLIRWIPSTIHFVAFFNNLVLIASFLGLGIGMVRKGDPAQAVSRAFLRLGVVVVLLIALQALNPAILLPRDGDYGVNEGLENAPSVGVPMLALLLGVFVVAVWTTIPFGQLV